MSMHNRLRKYKIIKRCTKLGEARHESELSDGTAAILLFVHHRPHFFSHSQSRHRQRESRRTKIELLVKSELSWKSVVLYVL